MANGERIMVRASVYRDRYPELYAGLSSLKSTARPGFLVSRAAREDRLATGIERIALVMERGNLSLGQVPSVSQSPNKEAAEHFASKWQFED